MSSLSLKLLCRALVALSCVVYAPVALAQYSLPLMYTDGYPIDTFTGGQFYTGQGFNFVENTYNIAPDYLAILVAQVENGAPNVKDFGFQIKRNNNFIECLTEIKTVQEWGLASVKPDFQWFIMPLNGSDCTANDFASGNYSLFSISATNTNTSIIGTEVEWYGFSTFGAGIFENFPILPPIFNNIITAGTYNPQNIESWDTEFINIIEPTFGTTTATTSVDIQVFFSTPLTFDVRPQTIRTIVISDAVDGTLEYLYQEPLDANAFESLTVNLNLNLATGSKNIEAYYTTTNGVIYSDVARSFFNVITNSYQQATGLENPTQQPQAIDCETFDVACQFQKALVFVFVPSPDVLNKFANLWQSLRTKVPFGYVTVTIDQLSALDTQESGAYSLGTLPFMDTIFTPLKTILASILWGIFAIWFYHARLKRLEI